MSNQLTVGGSTYTVQDAAQPWSLTSPATNTLRFEVRPGDQWSGDVAAGVTAQRSEIAGTTTYAQGTNLHVSYGFEVEPGTVNNASWLVVGQFHQSGSGWSPPFDIGLVGDKMTIMIDEAGNNANAWSQYHTIYTDSQNIVRGHNYAMQIDADFSPTNGHLTVIRDGVTLVNYNGPLGWSDMGSVYWKEGVYRAASDTTIAADYSNLSVTTGAAPSQPPPPAPTPTPAPAPAPDPAPAPAPAPTPTPSPPASGSGALTAPAGGGTVQGGDGADTLTGDAHGSSHLFGGSGDDVINSQGASDTVNGNAGNDIIHGGAGHDVLSGGRDNDALFGDTGADTINGNLANDTIHGGAGASVLRGGAGDDMVIGGAGNDQIWGDKGSDTVTGGAGADTFHTFSGAGVATVTDFHQSEGDRVHIDDGAHFTATQSGANVLVDLGAGSQMILQNTQLSSLQPGWIF